MTRPVTLSAIAVAVALMLGSVAHAQNGPPAASVRVDPVTEQTVDRKRNVTGEIRAARRSNVAAEASGLVLEMPVEVGDTLEKGHTIAKLDDTLARIELRRRESELRAAEATIREREALAEQTRRDVKRIRDLRARNSASQSELDDAITDLDAAKAQLARAEADLATREAQLDQSREELRDMTLRAPFDGAVVRRDVEIGQWISEGQTALELVEYGRVDVYLDVPESYINAVASTDEPITLMFASGRLERRAPITAVVDDADPQSRTFPVRIRLQNEDRALRPGMSVTGVVPTGELTNALTVHKDAILRDDAGAFVYFVREGKATPARVTTLYAVGDRVAVRAAQLSPGMNLITEGNERLFPTQPVEIIGRTDAGEEKSPQGTNRGD